MCLCQCYTQLNWQAAIQLPWSLSHFLFNIVLSAIMYPAHDASRIQNFFNTPCMQAGLTNTDHHWWLSRSSVTSTSRQCRQYTYINCRHVYSSVNEFTRISRGHWIHKTWSLNMHHPQAIRPATENSNWLSLACKLQHYNNWVSTAILYRPFLW